MLLQLHRRLVKNDQSTLSIELVRFVLLIFYVGTCQTFEFDLITVYSYLVTYTVCLQRVLIPI